MLREGVSAGFAGRELPKNILGITGDLRPGEVVESHTDASQNARLRCAVPYFLQTSF